jgi:hypothetical protein
VGSTREKKGGEERGNEIFILATCSLLLAKAGSAATLPQQERNNSVGVMRGRVDITGFICTVVS